MPIRWDTSAIVAKVRTAAARSVARGVEDLRTDMVSRILDGQKTGRIYRRRGVEHQASAPGQSPASDTGNLAGSIEAEHKPGALRGRVRVGAKHGRPLEHGTPTIEPRPFARPAVAAMRPLILADMRREIARALKG